MIKRRARIWKNELEHYDKYNITQEMEIDLRNIYSTRLIFKKKICELVSHVETIALLTHK